MSGPFVWQGLASTLLHASGAKVIGSGGLISTSPWLDIDDNIRPVWLLALLMKTYYEDCRRRVLEGKLGTYQFEKSVQQEGHPVKQ